MKGLSGATCYPWLQLPGSTVLIADTLLEHVRQDCHACVHRQATDGPTLGHSKTELEMKSARERQAATHVT